MRIKPQIYFFLTAILGLITGACSNTRFLADDQLLYTGKKEVMIADSGQIKDTHVRQITESVTFYKPNNSIGGKRVLLPVGLWIYNYRKPEGNKKPGWFYRMLAKEPVLVSTVNPEVRCSKLESELFGKGYFYSRVWSRIDTSTRNKHKAGITYFVKVGKPFRYNEISFAPPVDALDTVIISQKKDLSLKPNNIFDLETIKSEGKKISERVQEEGYFYFNQSHLEYIADTTHIPNMIDLTIGRNTELMQNAGKKYSIGDVTVSITGDVDSLTLIQKADTVIHDGIRIISKGIRFEPEVISGSIYFREGDIYSVSKHRQTMSRLNSFGIFKFINIRYIPYPDTLLSKLDILIELTPMKNISLDLEANIVTKSTGFSGPGFVATVAHGNLGGKANKLQLKLNGGFEWQWSNNSSSTLGTISYNAGLSSSIIFPKLIIPAWFINTKRFYLPQTSVTLGFELLNKIQYYKMSSINFGFGYQWKKPDKITHQFYPVFINSIYLMETTPEFDSILMANPYIKKSFEEQFIVGMKYDFIYDNSLTKKPHGFYFQASVSTAGNLLDLFKKRSSAGEERPYSVAGSVYSQFMKLSTDIRYYRNFNNKSLAFRLYSGIGFPYSNSVVMPYVEQYYSGGSNSVRAFIARSLGPGSLPPPDNSDIIDQTGDIKLEGNMEFRFRISKVTFGAIFLDAGNVWLLNPDETRPGAEFHFSTFADQLAVGTGAGLRFDFNFFVLRTDFGFPLRTPYTTNGTNWLGTTKDVFDGMVFSLAIGYPF
jgi:outer membrane protein insertion porin family